MLHELKLHTISDAYIQFLSKYDKKVLSNREDNRCFNRKYLGIVLVVNNVNYFGSFASPKDTNYFIDDLGNMIKI